MVTVATNCHAVGWPTPLTSYELSGRRVTENATFASQRTGASRVLRRSHRRLVEPDLPSSESRCSKRVESGRSDRAVVPAPGTGTPLPDRLGYERSSA